MSYKIFTLGIIWLCLSIIVTVIFSTQDKEWWIGEENIKNICDLMAYVENDDIRGFGMLITFPIFFTCALCFFDKKSPSRISVPYNNTYRRHLVMAICFQVPVLSWVKSQAKKPATDAAGFYFYKLPAGRVFAADVNVLPVLRPSRVSSRIWNGGNGMSIPCSRKPARISWWIS